jgi:hypothetical protein
MELVAFGAGMGAMYILAGLLFRNAVNSNISSEWGNAKMSILESLFWPIFFYGGEQDHD